MERQMKNEMETGYKDPSIQILPTLGPKVCKYYPHWAIWSPRLSIPDTKWRFEGVVWILLSALPSADLHRLEVLNPHSEGLRLKLKALPKALNPKVSPRRWDGISGTTKP